MGQYHYLQIFGALCLQSAFPDVYDLMNNDPRDDGPAGVFKTVAFDSGPDTTSIQENCELEPDEVPLFISFVKELQTIYIDNGTFDDEAFNMSMAHSAITSTSAQNEQSRQRVRTTDPDERRNRLDDRTNQAWIKMAERFEEQFAERSGVFAAQSNPELWTVYRDTNGPRIGVLAFQKSQLKVTLEFRTENPERLQEVQDALENNPGKFVVKKTDQKNGVYSELQILKITTEKQMEHLAKALRPLYS